MAPAIWGETLKRPGSLTSTSVPPPSMRMSATSPSPRSRPGLHAHMLERVDVIVERVTRQKEADRIELLLQPLGRKPSVHYWQPKRILSVAAAAKGKLKGTAGDCIVLAL